MIRFTFARQHNSILSFPDTELASDFVVITGINGAGKSHLLEAIESGAIAVEGINPQARQIRRFHHTNMQPKDTKAANPTQLWTQRSQLWNEIGPQLDAQKQQVRTQLLQQGIPSEHLVDIGKVCTWTQQDVVEIVGDPQKAAQIVGNLDKWLTNADNLVWQSWTRNSNRAGLAQTIRQQCSHSFGLTEGTFYEHVPLDWNPTDVFQQNFAPLFSMYHRQREENKINKYYATQEGEDRQWMENKAFIARFGLPPWETVNKILETARLPIRVNHPEGAFDQPFTLTLRHTEFECDVKYDNLSSGEKIIISLAHCLYYAQSENAELTLPRLLLLDEPDAPLHPTMAKSFMDVIEKVLVRGHGVKVIMTTHSPSTVAFAPDGAVHTLQRAPRHLSQSSRDTAISVLTDGFATVIPSTRFVIVEAAFDQDTYQKLFDKVYKSDTWKNRPPLLFVRASDQDNRTGGGSGQVSNWAEKLSSSGLTFFRGILDRDIGNTATDVVDVLGRYSIENYLLDPIAIYAYFIEKDWHANVIEIESIQECNVHMLSDLPDSTLQKIANEIYRRIETFRNDLRADGSFEIHYRNGHKIIAPTWLRDTRGHDLATIIRNCFRDGERYIFSRNLDELVLMVSAKLPGFISVDLEELFVRLAI